MKTLPATSRLDALVTAGLQAGRDLDAAVEGLVVGLETLRALLRAGVPVSEIGGGPVSEAWAQFQAAVTDVQTRVGEIRVEGFRAAVDDCGLTYTEIARIHGCSRQRVTDLVNQGRAAHERAVCSD